MTVSPSKIQAAFNGTMRYTTADRLRLVWWAPLTRLFVLAAVSISSIAGVVAVGPSIVEAIRPDPNTVYVTAPTPVTTTTVPLTTVLSTVPTPVETTIPIVEPTLASIVDTTSATTIPIVTSPPATTPNTTVRTTTPAKTTVATTTAPAVTEAPTTTAAPATTVAPAPATTAVTFPHYFTNSYSESCTGTSSTIKFTFIPAPDAGTQGFLTVNGVTITSGSVNVAGNFFDISYRAGEVVEQWASGDGSCG